MSDGTPPYAEGQDPKPKLEDVLGDWIRKAMPRMDPVRAGAMARRLGWAGSRVISLEEAGQAAGVTRERVRQIQKVLEERLARTRPPNLEFLNEAASRLANADVPWRDPGTLLRDFELSNSVLPTAGIRRFLRHSHLDHVANLDDVLHDMSLWQEDAGIPVREARRLASAVGVVSTDWLTPSMPDLQLFQEAIRTTLVSTGWVDFLDETWFWSPRVPYGRNRARNLMRKMLAACGPLSAGDIVAGLERQRRLGRLPRLPSEQAVHLFAEAHPEFVVHSDGNIGPTEPLDPIDELDRTEETLYLILSEAEDGFVDRQEFQEQAIARGVNPNTFSVYTSYSPILANPVVDRWTLRGRRISPAALAAHAPSRRRRRYVRTDWLSDGTLRLEREVPTVHSTVITIPAALARFVAEREFSATDASGTDLGIVRFNSNGGSWGYSKFIDLHALEPGDVIRLDLNLSASTVLLSRTRRENEGSQRDG